MISTLTFGQKKISGKYSNKFGEKIELKTDSTFTYNWQFDLASSWSKGKWSLKNDTIFFDVIPIMDTLKIVKNNKYSDSLILSSDQKPGLAKNIEFITNTLSSGGQNRQKPPKKLFIKNGKLFRLNENNEIDKKQHQQPGRNKKYKTYFYKTD
ncbi:hypothetical protein ML462_16030 [Gramella lutea]|uniref:Uncharacterized protein n=1 Tax=Christiangramia lutea TaxID=1607951 RepID=A0A9X2AAM6_9FLAO|nr:hypothetical protein [Christiangramia lutea]MCH4824680.1 hypothetical protein [Christiangramia lutea]